MTDRTFNWGGHVLWRLAVAAVLSAAATTALGLFLTVLIGQLVVPASRPENIGLNVGVAAIAALVGLAYGMAGGLVAAAGALVGWLLARAGKLSRARGSWLVSSFSAIGALSSVAVTKPTSGGWLVGIAGAALVGLAVGVTASKYIARTKPLARQNLDPHVE